MRKTRPQNPSHLAGEVAARARSVRATGERPSGAAILGDTGSRGPSPGPSLRSRPSSPARFSDLRFPEIDVNCPWCITG
jgi:hypothetical protein